MDDLRVAPGPGAPRGLLIPAAELVEQFSRSSGPGGQSVNTADSRVQLSFDIGASTAISQVQSDRIITALGTRLTGTVLTLNVEEHRSQRRNRITARQRLADLLREALIPPVPRRPTKPTRGSQRRRLEHKRQRSEVKQQRRRPRGD